MIKTFTLNEVADIIMELEIPVNIDDMFNKDGSHITQKKYGQILVTNLCDILRSGKTFGGRKITYVKP